MPSILDDVGSLLSNPAVMELLPAVTGAIGGALTSPRLAGGRGAIGSALLGGTQGLEQGAELGAQTARLKQDAEMNKMLAKHYDLEDQIAQGNLDSQNKVIQHFNALPESEQGKYGGDWHTYLDVMKAQQINNLSAQGLLQQAAQRMTTPMGKAQFAAQGVTDVSQLARYSPNQLKEILKQTAPPTPEQQEVLAQRADYEKTTAQQHEESMQLNADLRQQGQALQASIANMTANIALMGKKDARQRSFETEVDKLNKLTDTLTAGASEADPTDPNVKQRWAQRNAMAARLKNVADKNDLVYEEGELEPKGLGSEPGVLNKLTGGKIATEKAVVQNLGRPLGTTRRADGDYPDPKTGGIVRVVGGKVYQLPAGKGALSAH